MDALSTLLLLACSAGQAVPAATVHPGPQPVLKLKLPRQAHTPQETMRMLVDQELARRNEPGATVEVIGTNEETALKLLSVKVRDQARLAFRVTDKLQHRELYAFMQQDPSHPKPVMFIP
jgi:hypothetical protein